MNTSDDDSMLSGEKEEDFAGLSRDKAGRILSLYDRLLKGTVINKKQAAQEFSVTEKTIQRDIEDLRAYLHNVQILDQDKFTSITYDRIKKGYYLYHHTG